MVRIGLTTLNPLEILVTWSFSAVTYLEVSWVPWTRLGWGTITELIVRDQKRQLKGAPVVQADHGRAHLVRS